MKKIFILTIVLVLFMCGKTYSDQTSIVETKAEPAKYLSATYDMDKYSTASSITKEILPDPTLAVEIKKYLGESIRVGTYLGNGIAGIAVPHGLGVKPAVILITSTKTGRDDTALWIEDMGSTIRLVGEGIVVTTINTPDVTNFYLPGNVSGNRRGRESYYWIAVPRY